MFDAQCPLLPTSLILVWMLKLYWKLNQYSPFKTCILSKMLPERNVLQKHIYSIIQYNSCPLYLHSPPLLISRCCVSKDILILCQLPLSSLPSLLNQSSLEAMGIPTPENIRLHQYHSTMFTQKSEASILTGPNVHFTWTLLWAISPGVGQFVASPKSPT